MKSIVGLLLSLTMFAPRCLPKMFNELPSMRSRCQFCGVVTFDAAGRATSLVEKPAQPSSNYAVTGLYMYDHKVWDIIKTLKPSGRGELEITDVNNAYIERNDMTYAVVDGWWSDAGTFDSLLRANILVASQSEPNSEEISEVAIQTSASILR